MLHPTTGYAGFAICWTREALITMDVLRYLDQGDVEGVHYVELRRAFAQLEILAAHEDELPPDDLNRNDEILLAQEIFEYWSKHLNEFESLKEINLPRIKLLRTFLTDPDDVKKLDELQAHFDAFPDAKRNSQ